MGLRSWLGAAQALIMGYDRAPGHQFHSDPNVIDTLITGGTSPGSVSITRATALGVPAVYRGRNLICSVSTLPLKLYDPNGDEQPSPFLRQIDLDVPNVVTLAQTVEDLLFEGVAWWRVTSRDFAGFPMTASRLDPSTVSLQPPSGRSPAPLPAGTDPRNAVVYVDGREVPARELLRFDSPNPGLLAVAKNAIRRAILLDRAAEMYAGDPMMLAYFTAADNADEPEDDELRAFLSQWTASRRDRATAYIPKWAQYNTVESSSPRELQLVELQRQAGLDLANALGVDAEELGISTTSRTYFNAQDRRQSRINDMLAPFMRAITDRLSMPDVTRRNWTVRFDLTDYMKGDPQSRTAYYQAMTGMGAMSEDEVRAAEGLTGPAPGRPEPAPSTTVEEPVDAAQSAGRRAGHTFDAGAGVTLTFAVDPAAVQFSVDRSRRVIEGLAVPYGEVATKGGMSYRFRRGSLKYGDVSRVKHLRDHMTPVGRALALKETPAGLVATLSVGRGPEGDRLLEQAEDGVYDGLSIGVDFDAHPDSGDVKLAKDGVYDVLRADLREVSTTWMPAYDNARVTRVAASRTGGNAMPCQHCGQTHADGVTCPTQTAPAAGATYTAEDVARLLAGLRTQPDPVPAPPAPPAPPEGPAFVNPVRTVAASVVTEAAPYRFDRNGSLRRGTHEFSGDLFAAFGRAGGGRSGANGIVDQAAYDRVMGFISEQFDVATTDVNELNPTRNRQDMYVDQREYRYPVWEAINKGTLGDITPFTFPKFSSASGLVAAHTEGNEPTSGTFVTTSQTVTPSAISGKAKITRETWDQGGNPQISNLIWRQMQRGWYEALEAAAVAVLDAASPTQIDLSGTPGLDNDDLDQALTDAFASLQYIRGGFSMDTGFAQIDLYKKMIAATDSTGRRLYPAIGPQNATGTVSRRFGAVDVNGVVFYPAWALAATGTVAASSYLFDREVVHGWASAPQRLTFEYEVAHIYMGIWGYKATAISDINGVREIVYDPA